MNFVWFILLSINSGKGFYFTVQPDHPTGDGDGSEFYEAMRNEVRHAVYEIRTELEKVCIVLHPFMIQTFIL